MRYRWVECPCRYCVPPERHANCHGSCEKYSEYKKVHDAERDRIWKEDNVDRQVYEIQRGGIECNDRPYALKHGRMKKEGDKKHRGSR